MLNYSIPPKTYFEIASLGYLLVLVLISSNNQSQKRIRSYRLFRSLEINMLLALLVSILTYTFAYPELGTPVYICTLLRTTDSIMCVMASRVFAVYLLEYIDTKGRLRPISIIGNILFATYLILMFLNLPLKFVLWYAPDGTYMHGTFFIPIVFSAPVFYLASGLIMLAVHMKALGSREQLALSIASFVTLFGTVIQAATGGAILLSLPFGAAGVFVLYYSLETADYYELIKTNEKLTLAEQDASKANRAKSDFLANMSHEIRTPLNAVLGMDELILLETAPDKQYDPSSTTRIREYAGNIRDAGNVLLSVINDILDITKIESGKMEIKPAPYRLRALVNDVESMIRLRAEQKGLSYVQQIDPELPDCLIGDELRIRQIMINLLTNSVKYTDSGEIRLDVFKKEISDDSVTLFIQVKDTGIGIRAENLPHIFGDFNRIDDEHNRRIEGTGLGLSIVKRIIGLMNGGITVASTYGTGSVFTVLLPQTISRAQPGTPATETGRDQLSTPVYHTPDCRYLVVDDNKLNLLVAKRFLDGLGGQVDTVLSGEEALIMMKQTKYDLIFMDHMMPTLDGIETYKISLQDPENLNKETPMIMMTANALSGDRELYLDSGFADYVSKPVDIKELLRIVKHHLPPGKTTP